MLILAVMIMAFLFVPLAVFVIDSGLIEAGYLQLGESLQAAAEDGASSLDAGAYRQSGGQILRLDPASAKQTAYRSLRASQLDGLEQEQIQVQGNTVTVKAQIRIKLLGVGTTVLSEQKSATFAYGS